MSADQKSVPEKASIEAAKNVEIEAAGLIKGDAIFAKSLKKNLEQIQRASCHGIR